MAASRMTALLTLLVVANSQTEIAWRDAGRGHGKDRMMEKSFALKGLSQGAESSNSSRLGGLLCGF